MCLYQVNSQISVAGRAQSVERQALNLMVEGSSPSVGAYNFVSGSVRTQALMGSLVRNVAD